MAKRQSFSELILNELQEIKAEVKEVRQKDIPDLHTMVATLKNELDHVKEKTSARSMVITSVGGLIAVATSIAMAYFK